MRFLAILLVVFLIALVIYVLPPSGMEPHDILSNPLIHSWLW